MKKKIYFLLSMIIFGAVGIFAKFIALPSSQIALCLSTIGTFALALVLLVQQKSFPWRHIKKNLGYLLAASLLLSGNWIFLFNAYKETTIANAALSYYLAPVLVIIAAPFLLSEAFSRKKALCVATALLGLFLILHDNNTAGANNHMIGILYGFLAAVFYAALTLVNKFITALDGLTNTFLQLLLSALFLAAYTLWTGSADITQPAIQDIYLLLILGIFHGGIGFYLFFTGMAGLDGQSIAVLSYADPLTSLLLSLVVLNEPMQGIQLLGAALLFAAIWIAERSTPQTGQPGATPLQS